MDRIVLSPGVKLGMFRQYRAAWLLALLAGSLAVDVASGQEGRRSRRSRAKAAEVTENRTEPDAPAKGEKGAASLTLDDVISFAEKSRASVQEVKDYTAVFTKTEMVKGRVIKQVMDMKFRTKPFSVYLKYRSGDESGRQAIFVEGRNDNRLAVKEVGLKGVVPLQLRLDSPMVMDENRYPVTHVGIANLLKTAISTWEHENRIDGIEPDVKFFPNAKLGDVACQVVQVTEQKPHKELRYHIGRVYFDKETRLPVRAECYGWPRRAGDKPPLVEDYIYTNLKLNVGLTDADFDPARYGF